MGHRARDREAAQARKANRRRVLALILIGGLLALGAVVAYQSTRAPQASVGEAAPEYRFTDTYGETYALSGLRGKPVIITTMAAWCLSCAQEHYALREINNEYNGGAYPNERVAIVSLDVDPQDTPEALREFQDRYGGAWSFAMDTDDATRKFDITRLDTTLVLDRSGNVVYRDTEPTSADEFRQALQGVL